MERIPTLAVAAARAARPYDFGTFSVGVTLPEGMQEREDELRSYLKVKGMETVRTQAATRVAEIVSERLGKRVDKIRPDLTLVVEVSQGLITPGSRPLFFYGRYTKPPGVPQRRELCRRCSGAGCNRCGNTGFEKTSTVEGELRRRLAAYTRSDRMTFTWLGSEDRQSRVYAPGRPFVVEVKNPVKRSLPRRFVVRLRGAEVRVSSGRVLPARPLKLPTFRFRTAIVGRAASKVTPEGLTELKKRFRRTQVRFERPHDKPALKTVYRTTATVRGRNLLIDAELDGGLPVKRFVSGDLVSPSVSEVLKTEVECRRFDICEVKQTGVFEFAEITRSQKKN